MQLIGTRRDAWDLPVVVDTTLQFSTRNSVDRSTSTSASCKLIRSDDVSWPQVAVLSSQRVMVIAEEGDESATMTAVEEPRKAQTSKGRVEVAFFRTNDRMMRNPGAMRVFMLSWDTERSWPASDSSGLSSSYSK